MPKTSAEHVQPGFPQGSPCHLGQRGQHEGAPVLSKYTLSERAQQKRRVSDEKIPFLQKTLHDQLPAVIPIKLHLRSVLFFLTLTQLYIARHLSAVEVWYIPCRLMLLKSSNIKISLCRQIIAIFFLNFLLHLT